MVFYRKYRPQKIDELDNEAVRESLYSIFSKGSSAHAFLFTGPKGLGKTSTARIIAKVINCEKHKDLKGQREIKEIEPCNKCEQCVSITNGTNLDILEIDGASNRGIDEIRDLKEKINLAPFKASKKIYIIDEVHMLTTEAFNALLKTLEEPPAHAVFILCTTEQHKVPATIASRCLRLNFTRATAEELVRSLQRIVKAEEIKADKEALLEIAKLSDGSFRDGVKILEEIFVFAGRKNITADLVNEKFNSLGIGENINSMLQAFADKDTKRGFEICQNLAKQGADFKFFIEQLTDTLHLMLLQKVGVEKAEKEIPLSVSEIRKLFEILSDAYLETKTAILAQMPLELAILEWGEEKKDGDGSFSHAESDAQQSVQESNSVQASLSGNRQSEEKENSTKSAPISNSLSGGKSSNSFTALIEEVKNHNHLIAGVLRSCSVEDVQDGKLKIVAKSKFHAEKLEEEKTLKILEEAATKVYGKEIKVQIIQGGDK
jgi:DNA polymerase-3 subunit gamma/tau